MVREEQRKHTGCRCGARKATKPKVMTNISEKSPGPGNNNLTVLNNFNGRDLLGIKR